MKTRCFPRAVFKSAGRANTVFMGLLDRIRDTAEDAVDTAEDTVDSVTGGNKDNNNNNGSDTSPDNPAREQAEDEANQSLEGGGFSPIGGGSGFATTPGENGNQDITVSDEPTDTGSDNSNSDTGVSVDVSDETTIDTGSESTTVDSSDDTDGDGTVSGDEINLGDSSNGSSTGGGSGKNSNAHTDTLDSPPTPEQDSGTPNAPEGFGDNSEDQPDMIREQIDDQGNVVPGTRQEFDQWWRAPSTGTPDQELDPVNPNAPEPVQERQKARQRQQREIRSAEFQR